MPQNLRTKYLYCEPFTLPDLLDIMKALRNKETGCPWDIVQTFESIVPYTIEEAYEVADAIAKDDMSGLKEELGDLLLQTVYHAQMANEQDQFTFDDIVDAISRKMIRRHPHVFGSEEERAAGVKPGFWESIKSEEKKVRATQSKNYSTVGILDQVPVSLPALTRAVKLQKAAARVGFDWPDLKPVQKKVEEEWGELTEAVASTADVVDNKSNSGQKQRRHMEEEFGDLMFALANFARHLDIEPEQAVRNACDKFRRRFSSVEHKLAEQRLDWKDMDLSGLDEIWELVKKEE